MIKEKNKHNVVHLGDCNSNSKPKSYLLWSILNISLCFCSFYSLLFSIKAITYSFKTQNDLQIDDLIKARQHSKLAFKFNVITNLFCLFGFIFLVFLFIFSDKILNYFIAKAFKV